ncbi:hypothetical protein [Brytella acorum]|uniref:Uncharacterized protein n=1 Tax=Brytella acorum TaxID=2959299 RepID=A0AA35UNB9_9PROT|nr:hypothetical protein [Brytella acorum]MDF3624077.1 hypothetical protein [Brytella acorum]CAI9120606.1 hypothetical protein LMG32879_001440 [Brytella acorum]
MLDIRTFDAKGGGNVLYKALAHPIAAEALETLSARLQGGGEFAIYDPDDRLATLAALYPAFRPTAGIYTHDSERVGSPDSWGRPQKALTTLSGDAATTVLVPSFEHEKIMGRLARVIRDDQVVFTLQDACLPGSMLSNPRQYLDKLNFATNFAFFRDDERFSTRLVTANYWCNYGATHVRYWMRLFDGQGEVLAEWEHPVPDGPAGIVIDSAEIRTRFDLPAFCGQLFIHVLGARGHDVVKYALDVYGKTDEPSLSVTHDANAWPSPRFATLPAPAPGERIVLWVQNSHATPIPAGTMTINPMGVEQHAPIVEEIGPFATHAVDIGALLPGLAWPTQLEFRAGNHLVRPRYEVSDGLCTRIAHMNVERSDLRPEPALRQFPADLGRGFLLPFPVLDPKFFESWVQPTPMSESIESLPVRLDLFGEDGQPRGQHFLGNLPRGHRVAVALHDLMDEPGHADLVYDFRDGGEGDGWLHGLMRYRLRANGHTAETSFGSHIFNTLMTWRHEPQSYSGPPPGLTTRLFLKLGQDSRRSFSCLIYPASITGLPDSETILHLHDANGVEIAQSTIRIAASGSHMVWPHEIFGVETVEKAGAGGYVLIRDLTCRLFGYHGQRDATGAFSLDHMFGF